ncbi:MAG: hypothetical protein E7602_04150 [Ruminococcaceae bacterium]|nr:hypothetical protein [Oscillospiraceae bacterium]
MGKIKRILSLLFASLLVILTFSGCGCAKISEEEAKLEIKKLVDASYDLNVIIYGEGLPYYERTDTINQLYAPVADTAKYKSISNLKVDIRKTFSESYSKILEATAFEGQEGVEFGYHNQPRYIEVLGELMVLKDFYNVDFDSDKYGEYEGIKVQKYNTNVIKIVKISKRFVEGEITSVDGKTTIRVTLVLENGEWRLDSPTY